MLRTLILLPLFCTIGGAQPDSDGARPTKWQISARKKAEIARDITWLTHEPPEFLFRRGNHFDDEPERYERMYDPRNLKRMAEAGVRFGRLYFYKGFGLEYERKNIEKSKRAAELMHQLGMKVSLYVAGTMFTETLYRELPEARNWEQRDQDGRWVPYGIQTYRHYACPNEPAYREYLKRILKIGVEELHADEIAFDNLMLQPEPKSCRCTRCIREFHEFLRRRYPDPATVRRRFGLPSVDWIRVNEWDSPAQAESLARLDDPVLQEWVRFRCESLARHTNDLAGYVKSLNPGVAVHVNIKGLYSFNRYWTNAVYHPLFAGHIDVISFDTGGYNARLDGSTGALVSQIRSYKMARRLDSSCTESMRDDLSAAVHMAFNYEKPVAGNPGAPAQASNVFTPMLEFFREYYERYYTGTDNIADVAVLRNWPSMAFSISASWAPATLVEQVLIQHQVPFDLLHEEQIGRIGRYQAVVMAGQECVSDTQAADLLAYVRNGGVLVLVGNIAEYNDWRERRRVNPLLPARREGKGRIISIPQVVRADARASGTRAGDEDPEPGASSRRSERMSPSEWVLPKNHDDIYQAVAGALPRGLSIVVNAPLTTIVELLNRPSSRETIVHFINFDRSTKVGPITATVRRQYPGAVKSVTCLSPDRDDPVKVEFQQTDERIAFTVPSIRVYSMVVISSE